MKKLILYFTLSFIVLFSFLLPNNTKAFASEEIPVDEIPFDIQEFETYIQSITQEAKELNRDFSIFNNLTEEDYATILPKIKMLELKNPNLSEEELDQLAYELFLKEFENKSSDLVTPYYIAIGGANSQEVALCARHPIRCTKAKSAANTANKQTEAYYKSGFHNGNADAFRHAYWNNLMVKSIGAIPAAEFANAHEYGATNQTTLERNMDLHNNHLGRHDFKEYSAAQIRNAVTNGRAIRIENNKFYSTNGVGLR